MAVKRSNGFLLSRSGTATQVILKAHGGWTPKLPTRSGTEGDGMFLLSAGIRIHFYTTHGITRAGLNGERGFRVNQNPPPARPPDWSDEEYARLVQAHAGADFQREDPTDTVGDDNQMVEVFNYGLEPCWENNDFAGEWRAHKAGHYESDVDFLTLSKMVGERSLKQAVAASTRMNDGVAYRHIHYFPCREVKRGMWYDPMILSQKKQLPMGLRSGKASLENLEWQQDWSIGSKIR